jgi:hypothetical protein
MRRLVRATLLIAGVMSAQAPQDEPRTTFRVKYVAEGAVYIDGGRAAGLREGMRLSVRRPQLTALAELQILSVAESSAVCSIQSSSRPVEAGDEAVLSPEDAESVRSQRTFAGSRKYVQVVTFTEGDPIDEEMRAAVPRPRPSEVNRARGRIGVEYNTIRDGSGFGSSQTGLVFRGDMTRIGGSYWNLSGYWRGRLNSRRGSRESETLNDLLNRTYHLTLSYENPQSDWRAGFGRFYLPWAASLETIDGGYLGRRYKKHVTYGMFAGSTPDPTSWNYNPDRQLLGTFVNYEGGSFDNLRYTSTAGVAVSRVRWKPERQFAFFENAIFYKRVLSVYHNLEADKLQRPHESGAGGPRVSRSFLTVRVAPVSRLSIDFSHNHFRDIPTFDPRLVGTGLLDRLLFQGVSIGARIDLPRRIGLYTNIGRSDRSGDTRYSLNQMYGLLIGNIAGSGIRADLRYSQFSSAFGRGTYHALSLTREIGENLRLDVQAGKQNFVSPITQQNAARFLNSTFDWFLGAHYFVGGGFTVYRGRVQNYEQLYMNLGYRF